MTNKYINYQLVIGAMGKTRQIKKDRDPPGVGECGLCRVVRGGLTEEVTFHRDPGWVRAGGGVWQ